MRTYFKSVLQTRRLNLPLRLGTTWDAARQCHHELHLVEHIDLELHLATGQQLRTCPQGSQYRELRHGFQSPDT